MEQHPDGPKSPVGDEVRRFFTTLADQSGTTITDNGGQHEGFSEAQRDDIRDLIRQSNRELQDTLLELLANRTPLPDVDDGKGPQEAESTSEERKARDQILKTAHDIFEVLDRDRNGVLTR